MALPPLNDNGELPPGVHRATLREVLERFGDTSEQRQIVASRLERIYSVARSTGQVARFVVFGSFVTDEPYPNDVDILMVMDDSFDMNLLSADIALLFRHGDADAYFGASVFWARRSTVIGGEQAMIEFWQTRRDGGRRGIVEIVSEES